MRANPKKKQRKDNKEVEKLNVVKLTNELNVAVTLRTLKHVFGFGEKRLNTFMESYVALMSEVQDKRLSVFEAVQDASDITKIDIVKMLEDL